MPLPTELQAVDDLLAEAQARFHDYARRPIDAHDKAAIHAELAGRARAILDLNGLRHAIQRFAPDHEAGPVIEDCHMLRRVPSDVDLLSA